jgi:Arc/MetJ-type ribon-helix-helix transcriptional regulator
VNKKNRVNWNIPAPRALDVALEEAVEKDTHSTKSDFVRDAVRRQLEELGYKPRVFEERNSETCHLCHKTLPKNLANTTYYNGKIVHLACANEEYQKGDRNIEL